MISHVTTLANGIIGVSVLAMPFCFKQCGIILATVVLLLSSALSRLACHFLIKSAVMCRRKNFEFLAFHAFGPMGKFFVELCIIGFLLGTCIAYFVVVGDLGPQIIGEFINKEPEDIRTSLLITTAIFIVLPLGLLRNVSSLASVSTASIAFYICLVLKVIGDSTHNIFSNDCFEKIFFWRPAGMLQCLPIFALALFCQTQLFEIYETMPNATLEKMNQVVRRALNVCTIVYISVGLFGYIGFCSQPFSGNILMSFEPSVTSEFIKIGFVLSVAFSFPLVIFPCRASLNSLLFRRGYTHLETSTSYISETRFRCLTTFIVIISMVVGVMIPSIEFVLGIVGSTIGVLICLIFPATFFISISTKNTNERLLAQILIIIGLWIMILGTYANLYAMEQSSNSRVISVTPKLPSQIINSVPKPLINDGIVAEKNSLKQSDILQNAKENVENSLPKVPDKPPDENIRREPPVPVEQLPIKQKNKVLIVESIVTISPKVQEIIDKINIDNQLVDKAKKAFGSLKKIKSKEKESVKIIENIVPDKQINDELPKQQEGGLEPAKEIEKANKVDLSQKNDIAVDAIKKEESELAADKDILNVDPMQRREQLDKTLVKHIMVQKEMMQEQKELLKDIVRNKQELEQETGGEKLKHFEENKLDNQVENKNAKEVDKNSEKKGADNPDDTKKNFLQVNGESNGLPINKKNPQIYENIKINEVVNDKSVVKNENNEDENKNQVINNYEDKKKNISSKNVEPLLLDSNLKNDASIKKTKKDMVKKSNQLLGVKEEAAEITKSDVINNDANLPERKLIVQQDMKNNKQFIDDQKVNLQNKEFISSDDSNANQSEHNKIAVNKKIILNEHEI